VLINTCSIREKAESKTHSFAFDVKKLKKANPKILLGITGCVAQQEKEQILKDLPFVDLVLGPDNIDELPWILEELADHDKKESFIKTEFESVETRVWKTETKIINPGPSTFISVMKGCDHFCAYCVVPYTRGREKSRPIADIIEDVKKLCAQGVKEVTFLGQNINTFGKRTGESLEELFYRAHDIEALKRIRFTTSHPGDIKDELIRCFQDLPKLCSSFHLPVQSGSNKILRSMRRFYTREQYLERAAALREVRPDMAFSTDIIVGFPGETEEDFEATFSLAKLMRYDNAYSFLYSPRPGTSAYTRQDDTPESVKLERLTKLQTQLRRDSRELHEETIGKTVEVLIEGYSKKDPTRMTGRTPQNVPAHVEARYNFKPGDIVPLFVESATLTHLKCVPVQQHLTEDKPKHPATTQPMTHPMDRPHLTEKPQATN